VWNFMISTPRQILFGLINQKNEKGQTCRIYGSIQGFGGKNLRKRNHLEDLGINGRMKITLMSIFKKQDGSCGLDWTQDKDGWRAIVTAAMKLQVLQYLGNFLTS